MTVETVRDWLDGIEVADGVSLAGYFPDAFLDARIIRGTCETCRGSKVCPECEGTGGLSVDSEYDGSCRACGGSRFCPDCGDAPVSVIEPAAWERAMGCFTVDSLRGIDFEETLGRIAQALLPGARVADHKITVTAPANIGVDYGPDVGTLYAGDQIFVKLGAHR